MVAAIALMVSCREVSVAAVDVFDVTVEPASATVEMGASLRFTATIRDEQGRELIRPVEWTSDAPSVLLVSSSGEAVALGLGSARVTARVEGRSASADVTVRPRPVASVEVVPAAVSIEVGETVALQAVARDGDGSILSNRAPTWITNNSAVVTVATDGRATGAGAGTTTVEAEIEGVRGAATISVRAVVVLPVAAVRVDPVATTIAQGDSLQLRAVVTAGDGSVLAGRPVTWSSSAPSVAAVDAAGMLHALTLGTAVVTAASEGVAGQGFVTVTLVPVDSVEVTPATSTVFVGGTTQLQATVRAANGSVLTGRPVTWNSSNAQIASVDAAGLVTGNSAGSTTITASVDGVTGSATVFVAVKPVATVRIEPAAPSIFVGDQVVLQSRLTASDGSSLTGRTVIWTSSDPSVATVTSNGATAQAATLVGRAAGTTLITALAEGKLDTTTVTITSQPVASVDITPVADTVFEGGSGTFQATPRTAGGAALPNEPVTWSSSNSAVAVPTGTGPFGQTATVNAAASCPAGTSCAATITATAGGKQATAQFLVLRPAAAITVVPASATLDEGAALDLTATVVTAGKDVLTDRRVTWKATGPATVVGNGTFGLTATVTAGTCPQGSLSCNATVTAEVEGVTFDVTLLIRKAVSVVQVRLARDTLFENGATTAVATVLAADGTVLTDRTVAWSTTTPYASATAGTPTDVADVAANQCKVWKKNNPTDPDADEDCTVGIVATADGVQGESTLTVLKPAARMELAPTTASISMSGILGYPTEVEFVVSLFAVDDAPINNPSRYAIVNWSTQSAAVAISPTTGQRTTVTGRSPTGLATPAVIRATATENGVVFQLSATVFVFN